MIMYEFAILIFEMCVIEKTNNFKSACVKVYVLAGIYFRLV